MAGCLDQVQYVIDYCLGQENQTGFGSANTAEEVAEAYTNQIRGRVFFITGATSGMGRECAFVLAKHGGIVVLASRSADKLDATVNQIHSAYPGAQLYSITMDLSNQKSVLEGVREFERIGLHGLHALICNAGVAFTEWKKVPTARPDHDVDLQFATNYLGHFALVLHLLPYLIATGRGTGASGFAYLQDGTRLYDLSGDKYYEPFEAYGQSKLALLLFMEELNKRIQMDKLPVTVNALHPGAVNSSITRHFIARHVTGLTYKAFTGLVGKSVPQGASTYIYLAAAPEVNDISGKYFVDCRPEPYHFPPIFKREPHLREKLWSISASLTGLDYKYRQ